MVPKRGVSVLAHSPSTLFMARMVMVLTAGTAHAARWKYWLLASMASCPHLSPAARNHVNVSTTHQMDEAIEKKYNTIKRMVQPSWRVPCVMVDTIWIWGKSAGAGKGSLHENVSPEAKPITYARETIR